MEEEISFSNANCKEGQPVMDKQRDEFQELIRNFSLNDAQQPRRTPQPSAQTPQQPARQPSASAGRPQPQAGQEFLRGYPGARQGAQQRAYPPSGQPARRPDSPPAAAGRPQRSAQSVRERLSQTPSSRFDPAGFQPGGQPPSPPPAPPPMQPQFRAPAGDRPRPDPQPQQPPQQAARPQPPEEPQAAPAARFNPAGFEAPSAAPMAREVQPPVSRKNFTLNIANPEYQGIPDASAAAGSRRTPPPPSKPARSAGPAKPPEPPKPVRKRKRRRSGRVSRFFEALVLVMGAVACAVFLAIFALQSAGDMLGMNKPDIEAEITLSENETVTGVAERLKEIGIIEQPLTFELYAKLLKKDIWEPGTYELNTKMAYSQILRKFERGNVEQETVRIMFPEGQTIIQIAEKLEENHVCSASDFLSVADNGSFDFQFEDQIPDSPLRFHRLEGYIFPDTYDFYVGQNPESVVRRFLEIFNTRVTQDLYDLMAKRGLTLDETITLASIIQKETGNVENMYRVSSVFHNRLGNPGAYPRLQSDATTDYVKNMITPNLSSPNQEMFDAYDTYVCEGLPAGPINNPGLEAIKAALDPLETNYYFFLSDQKGEYHFSETIDQHNKFLASAGEAHGTAIDHSND